MRAGTTHTRLRTARYDSRPRRQHRSTLSRRDRRRRPRCAWSHVASALSRTPSDCRRAGWPSPWLCAVPMWKLHGDTRASARISRRVIAPAEQASRRIIATARVAAPSTASRQQRACSARSRISPSPHCTHCPRRRRHLRHFHRIHLLVHIRNIHHPPSRAARLAAATPRNTRPSYHHATHRHASTPFPPSPALATTPRHIRRHTITRVTTQPAWRCARRPFLTACTTAACATT